MFAYVRIYADMCGYVRLTRKKILRLAPRGNGKGAGREQEVLASSDSYLTGMDSFGLRSLPNLRFLVALLAVTFNVFAHGAQSEWASLDATGKLVYKTLPAGDRIMDFSYAGYMGGGVKLPAVPMAKTVAPSGGDDTAAIQSAIDEVSQLPLVNGFRGAVLAPSGGDDTAAIQSAIDEVSQLPLVNGFRGAVLLKPGTFRCSAALAIRTGGVVLRGYGPTQTTIQMSGDPHVCITVEGTKPVTGAPVAITNAYVPAGAMTFHAADASGFTAGDAIIIERPDTSAWIAFMGMDKLVRNHAGQTWRHDQTRTRRTIKTISGNAINVDVPLSDSLDAKYLNPPGATVVKSSTTNCVTQVGIENLHIVSAPQPIAITEKQNQAITVDQARDIWVRNLLIDDTINSIYLGHETRRVTVEDVQVNQSVTTKGAALASDFTSDGTQILINRCTGTGNHLFYFVTLDGVNGPNVLLNCVFHGDGRIQPHARWATGLLVDNCRVPDGGIDLLNRGEMGTGHGWTIGWGVAWNSSARSFVIQQPPGSANWAIGCVGKQDLAPMPFGTSPMLPQGYIDSNDKPVSPASLYLEQLRERLGEQAVANVSR
jgi:hypothetical protein